MSSTIDGMNPSPPTSDIEALLEGRYQVQRLLGRGGMGAVHLAHDLQLDRLVAIKELPEEYARVASLRERFLREVRMAASFSHPNIVPVYAVEEHGQSLAFVMGFIEGESLAERVRRAGPLSARETLRLLLDVAYALAYAHGRGVVHRDIKPDNIMIERATGRALLMDFGVARAIEPVPSQAGMTRVGEVVGTPEYMSPEQATGEALDGRSDLYALGLVAHFAVRGAAPFAGDSAARVLVRQLTEALPPLRTLRADLPVALATAVDRCVAKDRDDRFADAAALIEALDAAQVAAPEIPLAVRLFAQELETLSLVAFVITMVSAMILTSSARSYGSLDRFIPIVVILAVLFARAAQTRAEAIRLLSQGFAVSAVQSGMRAVLAEREEQRAQLRADETVVKRRKHTVIAGVLMVLASAILIFFAFASRTGTPGEYRTPIGGVIMLFSGLGLFGFGFVLLIRSPLRMPLPERLFKRFWLGWVGRLLFRSAGRAAAEPAQARRAPANAAHKSVLNAGSTAIPSATESTVNATLADPSTDADLRLAALEARLARLEKGITEP